jgi:hypothetical protein
MNLDPIHPAEEITTHLVCCNFVICPIHPHWIPLLSGQCSLVEVCFKPGVPSYLIDVVLMKEESMPSTSLRVHPYTRYTPLLKGLIHPPAHCARGSPL